MKGNILDAFKEPSATCFLVKIPLEEYIKSLPEDYRDYEVQREIVSNIYLDDLISTILENKHIPPIVLVVGTGDFSVQEKGIEIRDYKILDGLQRTFRLKIIYDTVDFFKNEISKSFDLFSFSRIRLSKVYKEELDKINSSSSDLAKIIDFFKPGQDVDGKFDMLSKRMQWFEVWTDIEEEEEVDKMLVLNAGHKPVKTKHQLELLFRSIIPIIKKLDFPEFTVFREKELSSTNYSKERQPGQFHFSHIITSILSFVEGKPLTTNINLIQKTQQEYFDVDVLDKVLNKNYLKTFISILLELDRSLTAHYQEIGIKWMGRETSLVGIFAATGKLSRENPFKALDELRTKIVENPSVLSLQEFEKERNSVDLAKVNIGAINKKAVYNGVYDILKGDSLKIQWSKYFKGEE